MPDRYNCDIYTVHVLICFDVALDTTNAICDCMHVLIHLVVDFVYKSLYVIFLDTLNGKLEFEFLMYVCIKQKFRNFNKFYNKTVY